MTMPVQGTPSYDTLLAQYSELYNDLGTFCSGNQGATIPLAVSDWGINSGLKSGINAYLQRHAIPVAFHEKFSLISNEDFIQEVFYSLNTVKAPAVVSIETEAPRELELILGVAFSKLHFPVVDGFGDCGFYHVNFGWGGKGNRWLTRYELQATLRYVGRFEPAGSGYAPRIRPKSGTLVADVTSQCVDALYWNTANGAAAGAWTCNGLSNQGWTLTAAGELRNYANKCLEVANFGTVNGTKAQTWDCWGGENQKWAFTPAGEIRGFGNKCLDFDNTNNGTQLQMWDCNGTSHQRFQLR